MAGLEISFGKFADNKRKNMKRDNCDKGLIRVLVLFHANIYYLLVNCVKSVKIVVSLQ